MPKLKSICAIDLIAFPQALCLYPGASCRFPIGQDYSTLAFIGEIGSNSSELRARFSFSQGSSLTTTRSIHILPTSPSFLPATYFVLPRPNNTSRIFEYLHSLGRDNRSPPQHHHHLHGSRLKVDLLTSHLVRCSRRVSCSSSTTQVQHGIHHQRSAQDQWRYQAGGEWAQEHFLRSEAQSSRPLYWGQPSRGRCSKQSEGLCRSTRWAHCHYVGTWMIRADPIHGMQANGCPS